VDIFNHFPAHPDPRYIALSILLQMELAVLPGYTAENGFSSDSWCPVQRTCVGCKRSEVSLKNQGISLRLWHKVLLSKSSRPDWKPLTLLI
jgi:hypothetical protein